MRLPLRRALLSVLLLVLGAAPAQSDDRASLNWGTCSGPTARTIDCTRNTGVDELVASAALPDHAGGVVTGLEVFIGFRFCTSATLPPWWQFKNAGSCRLNALTVQPTTADGECSALFSSTALATWSYRQDIFNSLETFEQRLNVVIAGTESEGIAIDPAATYDVLHLRISHALTTGAGACAGCTQPVWMYLYYGKLTYADGHYDFVRLPTGYVTASANGGACNRIVPVRNETWGRIKSQYR